MYKIPDPEQIQKYGWHTIQHRALTLDEARNIVYMLTGKGDHMEDNTIVTPIMRRVIGDTPEHGKHYIMDSDTECITVCDGGLAFSLGVACIEAEIARNVHRYWQVCHPNGVVIYHVAYTDSGQIVVSRVGG